VLTRTSPATVSPPSPTGPEPTSRPFKPSRGKRLGFNLRWESHIAYYTYDSSAISVLSAQHWEHARMNNFPCMIRSSSSGERGACCR